MTAAVMLRLGLGLVNRLGAIGTVGSVRHAAAVTLDSAAQESVDQRGRPMRASGKNLRKAASVLALLLSIAFALLSFGFTGIPLARIVFAVAVVAVLVARPANLVAVGLYAPAPFAGGGLLAPSGGTLACQPRPIPGPEL